MEVIRDTEAVAPNRRSYMAKNIAAAAVALVVGPAIGTGGSLVIHDRSYIAAMLTSPDADEVRIADALDAEGITGKRWVSCVDSLPESQSGETIAIYGKLPVPVALLDQSICDDIIDFANDPNGPALTYEQVRAVGVAAHESAHITLNEPNEARVECASFQNLPTLAQEFGATPDRAAWMQTLAIDLYHTTLSQEYMSSECRDGGLYDNDPLAVGVFPYPKPPVASNPNVG